MSVYTTELRFICEEAAGLDHSEGYQRVNDILDKARDKVFDFDYPIFDENYRNVLENKILKHYYTREIGLETVGLWKLKLDTKMNEIMPYYNQLYKSELIKFNPMYDVDLTTDYSKEHNGTDDTNRQFSEDTDYDETSNYTENKVGNTAGTENGKTTTEDAKKNDHWDMYSDTPQGGIDGVRDEKYLTNARHVTDDTKGSKTTSETENITNTDNTTDTTGNANKDGNINKNGNSVVNEVIKNTEDYLHHVVGKTGGVSYSKMLKEFRQTFLNIDMKIIDDLGELFMNVY